ncbi:MAG: alanine/ornithine racemase family PLP-dependent enzyme [Bacteroidales bacterium]|jgi:predicted amino acid racemase|nr:alanine/ornithine racemase family PLP-dependent enzyme [Bacteroidales bacterium]
MPVIELNRKKLNYNFNYLKKLLGENNVKLGIVSKFLCGEKNFLKELIDLGISQILDARIDNLKAIKEIDQNIETIYIRPPAKRSIKKTVKYADISFNTEFSTIKLLSEEAKRQRKTHKLIIMIEMGDLREGVLGEDFLAFYGKIFELPNIEVVGIGTNLNCLNGVMPSQDKLVQLCLYEQLIEAKFKKNIPYVSGGSSVTLELLFKKVLPEGINHFRIGETLFFGNNLFTGEIIPEMKQDIFKLKTEIIELTEKPLVPFGEIGENVAGEVKEFDEEDFGKSSYRAILDIGLLDIDPKNIKPVDKSIEIFGASSDMIVIDLGTEKPKYKVGDIIEFNIDYMGALSILSSQYINKMVV